MQPDSCTFDFQREFTDQLRIEGLSDCTISIYCLHVNLFCRHGGIPPARVSESHLKEYVCGLLDRYKDRSVALKIRSLKRFYGFLKQNGRILINPAANLKEPEIKRRIPSNILSEENMEAIRWSMKGDSFCACRDLAIIEVLYSTGIRFSELSLLKIADVDFSEGMLWIRKGKGGHDRCCVLGRHALSVLKTYLSMRGKRSQDHGALWISRKGTGLCKITIRYIIKHAAVQAGVKGPSNPHAWRHGVATSLLRRGASIIDVQKFLGHASVWTTQVYTHLTVQDLKEVHARTHPRENDPDVLPIHVFPTKISPRRPA